MRNKLKVIGAMMPWIMVIFSACSNGPEKSDKELQIEETPDKESATEYAKDAAVIDTVTMPEFRRLLNDQYHMDDFRGRSQEDDIRIVNESKIDSCIIEYRFRGDLLDKITFIFSKTGSYMKLMTYSIYGDNYDYPLVALEPRITAETLPAIEDIHISKKYPKLNSFKKFRDYSSESIMSIKIYYEGKCIRDRYFPGGLDVEPVYDYSFMAYKIINTIKYLTFNTSLSLCLIN